MSESLLEYVREVDLGTEEDHTTSRYCSRLIVRWCSDCGFVLTGEGQVADEIVAVSRREPLCQIRVWKLGTNDWSGLEGSVILQMAPKLAGQRHKSVLLGAVVCVAVLLGRQVFGRSHVAKTSVGM